MHWNHRVIRRSRPSAFDDSIDESFGIHEVFYEDNGKIISWTQSPIEVSGDTIEDLREYLEWMRLSLDKAILTERKNMFGRERLVEWKEESKGI